MKYLKKFYESYFDSINLEEFRKNRDKNERDRRAREIEERQETVNNIFIDIEKYCDINFINLIKTSINGSVNIYLSIAVTQKDYKSTVYVDILKYVDGKFIKNDFMESVKQAEMSGRNVFVDFKFIHDSIKNKEIYYRIELGNNLSSYELDAFDKDIVNIGKKGYIQVMKQQYSNWITLRKIKGRQGVLSSEASQDPIRKKWYLNYRDYKYPNELR